RARELTKRYGANIAVDHIDLEVGAGEIVGILGPNGSGKTTTILMLLGLTEPTSGHAEVAGFDPLREPLEVKRRVGYLPDQVGFYDGLSARDNLAYTGRLAGLPRHEMDERFAAAMDRVGLGDVGRDRVRTFSQGMRQRLGLTEVLMKRPSVAILDEPTTSPDLRAEIARELAPVVEMTGIRFAAPSLNEVYARYFEEARDAAQ